METKVATLKKVKSSKSKEKLVSHNRDFMKIAEVLSKLEKHEAECDLRYKRIEEKLGEQKISMKSLDLKIWGLAVLIIIAPMVHKFLS
jgi:hypothetical protein|tara:strand:- start:248 stop:511 length:264 start_codon:yes stop_codon:yes gene_type:complete